MIAATLWAEITISGFVFVLAGAFLVLKYLGVRDLLFVADAREYAAILSVLALAASYVMGILAHRLIGQLERALRPLLRRVNGRLAQPDEGAYARGERARVAILQYGSERLIKEYDYQFNFTVMFSQFSVGVPVAGICAALWLLDTAQSRLALPVLITCLVIGAGFMVARANQRKAYRAFKNDAYLEVERIRRQGAAD